MNLPMLFDANLVRALIAGLWPPLKPRQSPGRTSSAKSAHRACVGLTGEIVECGASALLGRPSADITLSYLFASPRPNMGRLFNLNLQSLWPQTRKKEIGESQTEERGQWWIQTPSLSSRCGRQVNAALTGAGQRTQHQLTSISHYTVAGRKMEFPVPSLSILRTSSVAHGIGTNPTESTCNGSQRVGSSPQDSLFSVGRRERLSAFRAASVALTVLRASKSSPSKLLYSSHLTQNQHWTWADLGCV